MSWRNYIWNIIFIIGVTHLIRCDDSSFLSDRQVDRYIAQLKTDPVGVKQLLTQINIDRLSEQNRKRYVILSVLAKDRLNESIQHEIDIQDAYIYYQDKPDSYFKLLSFFYYAKYLYLNGSYGKSLDVLLDAETLSEKEEALNGLIQYYIGSIQLKNYYLDMAIDRFRRSAAFFRLNDDVENEIKAYIGLGESFLQNNRPDSALYFLNEGLRLAIERKYTQALFPIHRIKGWIFRENKAYENAIQETDKAMLYATKDELMYISFDKIAIYRKIGKADSADFYFHQIEKSRWADSTLEAARLVCLHKAEIAERNADPQSAIRYYKNFISRIDSFTHVEINRSLGEIEERYYYEHFLNENNRLTIQHDRSIIQLFILSITLLLIIVFYYRKVAKSERNYLEAKNEILELQRMADSFTEREESLRNIVLEHFRILKKATSLEIFLNQEEKNQNKKLVKKVHEIIYGQDRMDWDNLYNTIDKVYSGFFSRLRNNYPQLDDTEFKICCLTYSKFSTMEISILLGLSVNTIHIKRSNLRKKIGVEHYQNLIDYLNQALN